MSKSIEERLAIIELRNKKVENDKAWETSWTRRLSIMAMTYAVVVIFLHYVVHVEPWINGLVPVIGFLLSTLSVSWLKSVWLKNHQ